MLRFLSAATLIVLLAWTGAGPPSALAKGPAAPKPPPTGTVAGTVRDAGGYLLADIEVTVTWDGAKAPLKGKSDAKGLFAVKGVPPGDVTILVKGKGRVPDQRRVPMPKDKGLLLEVTLRSGILFAGSVVDARGAPISGAKIQPVSSSMFGKRGGRFSMRIVRSDDQALCSVLDGTFAVDELVVGVKYVLEFTHPHFAKTVMPEVLVEAGKVREDLLITMADAAWLSGVVVDAAGKPVPKARIRRLGKDGDDEYDDDLVDRIEDGKVLPPTVTGNVSDDLGRFTIGGIDVAGVAEVEANIWADGFLDSTVKWTDLVAGKEKAGVNVALEPATATLDGRVTTAAGDKGVAGAVISVTGDAGRTRKVLTDAKGAFRVVRVKSKGPVTVFIAAKGYIDVRLENTALNAKGIAVPMQAAATLHVKVVDEDGEAFREIQLEAWAEGASGAGSDRPSSPYVFQGVEGLDHSLPLGKVSVKIYVPGYDSQTLGPWDTTAGKKIDGGTIKLVRTAR